jgi:hypothetical protein
MDLRILAACAAIAAATLAGCAKYGFVNGTPLELRLKPIP